MFSFNSTPLDRKPHATYKHEA